MPLLAVCANVVTLAPTWPTGTKAVLPDGARSMAKPCSLLELSVQRRVTLKPLAPLADSPLGAAITAGSEVAVMPMLLLAVAPRFETEFPALIEVWRFDPRLREALLRGLTEAGLDLHQG